MRIRFDPYNFGKPDPEPDSNQSQMSLVVTEGTGPNQSQKLEPDPHSYESSEAVEARNGAVEGCGRSQ
jgi:hypothetical protein